jgi:16S rRNA G966 N2-methylase RsmD
MGGQYLSRAVYALYGYEQRIFDIYHGVSTRGVTYTTTDKFHANTENWPYLGCQWPAFSFVLRSLPHNGTFVDLGSGKGKAILIAGTAPYEKVVGVEIDGELTAAAQKNIERLGRKRRAKLIECVTASVVDWEVPDDASIIFMHNPFFGETFRSAMENVFASYDRNPREMHIVYMFPWEHEWLLSTGRVQVETVKPEGWPRLPRWWDDEHVTAIYHITEKEQSAGPCTLASRRKSSAERRALQRWSRPADHAFEVGLL